MNVVKIILPSLCNLNATHMLKFPTMDFYHILPSNGAPQTYPSNHASMFSTPLDEPYILQENWEVALMNVTHSNCIDTFHDEKITIEERYTGYEDLKKSSDILSVTLTPPEAKDDKGILWTKNVIRDFVQDINKKFKNLLRLKMVSSTKKYGHIEWEVTNPDFIFVLSPKLWQLLELDTDVLTSWDTEKLKVIRKYNDAYVTFFDEDDFYVLLVPLRYEREKIIIKEKTTELNVDQLKEKFNTAMKIRGRQYATMDVVDGVISVTKTNLADGLLILCSKALHESFFHRQSGMYNAHYQKFVNFDLATSFKPQWTVYIYRIFSKPFNSIMSKTLSLKREQFLSLSDAIKYMNKKISNRHIHLSFNEMGIVTLEIKRDDLKIHFDNDLRDILGFDENCYDKKGVFSTSVPFSLTRRIQYLYIYCDVCDMVRVGNTKAPLLAAIPFNAKDCRLLTEKRFTLPMYVPVKKTFVSDITVGIYDDAGKIVPFHHDAITTIRLHFRRRQ